MLIPISPRIKNEKKCLSGAIFKVQVKLEGQKYAYFETARTPNDRAMYNSMITGMAEIFSTASSNTERRRKVNRILFSFQAKLLNLSANSGIPETSKYEETATITLNIQASKSAMAMTPVRSGSEVIKSALAGVGNPLNESRCVSSILKIARRNAEKMAIENAK
jgi:hypothetical protein